MTGRLLGGGVAAFLFLFPTPSWADITGPARVIDGDTLEIAGELVQLHIIVGVLEG